jgi:hypothetical protein
MPNERISMSKLKQLIACDLILRECSRSLEYAFGRNQRVERIGVEGDR